MPSVRINSVTTLPDGRYQLRVTYNPGTPQEQNVLKGFGSKQQFLAAIAVASAPDEETLLAHCGSWWAARSGDLSNTAIIVGKTFIEDWGNNNPIRVQ